MNSRGLRIASIAAPGLLFLYGIAHFFDGLHGTYGPGIAWTLGHIAFVLALIMFGFVIVGLYIWIERRTARHNLLALCAMIIGLVGIVAFIRSPIIDLVAGLRASNNAAMGVIQAQLNSYPSATLSSYFNFGPLLFQIGLLILMIQLAAQKPRQLQWWSPALLLAGFLVLGFDLNLLVLGAILIGIALSPLVSTSPSRRS